MAMLASPTPSAFFNDLGIHTRIKEPKHVQTLLPGVITGGRLGIDLDTVTIFDMPAVRNLARQAGETAWQMLQRLCQHLKMDDEAAQELLRWLVWHGFIDEGMLEPSDLPELRSGILRRSPRP